MTSPHEPVSPSAAFQEKSGINPIADFVMETDWSAGQVIQAVDEAGIGDDTIVIFTADNGHSHYTGWEGLIEAGHMPSGPYRGHKGDIWEGGHRVPLLVRWPGRIAPNSSSDQLVSLTDLFATVLSVLESNLPEVGAEDSISFLDAALGRESSAGRSSLVSHSNFGEFAYRDGPWKLVFKNSKSNLNESRGLPRVIELYNLEEDIAEERDLAAERREIVEQLRANSTRCFNRSEPPWDRVRERCSRPIRYNPDRALDSAPRIELSEPPFQSSPCGDCRMPRDLLTVAVPEGGHP